jgi:tetratricopeptide (TPR) repeat protein
MEHNVAMAIYSLLSRYDNDLVNECATNLRQSAITASERALAVFEKLAGADTSGANIENLRRDYRMQCARIQHLIGDLLKVGDASQDDLRAAVDHLNAALAFNALDAHLTAGVRESRALAIVLLEKPDDALIKQAIQDMEFFVNRNEEDRAWSEKMGSLNNLSRLYSLRREFDKAIGYAERAVSIALREIDQVIDEQILEQKASQYAAFFERLASLYAATQQPENG